MSGCHVRDRTKTQLKRPTFAGPIYFHADVYSGGHFRERKPIFEYYRFDAMFDTESENQIMLSNFKQSFCIIAKKHLKLSMAMFTFLLIDLVALIRYQTWRQIGNIQK